AVPPRPSRGAPRNPAAVPPCGWWSRRVLLPGLLTLGRGRSLPQRFQPSRELSACGRWFGLLLLRGEPLEPPLEPQNDVPGLGVPGLQVPQDDLVLGVGIRGQDEGVVGPELQLARLAEAGQGQAVPVVGAAALAVLRPPDGGDNQD